MKPTLGSTVYQFAFGISAGLVVTAAGAWLSWPSAVIPILKDGSQPVTLTGDQIANMVALMDFGNMISPLPSRYMMDSIGRKMTLILAGVCAVVASCSVLFVSDVWLIYLARIFAGFTKGIAFSVVPIYLAEVANTETRGALSTMFIGFLNVGMMYDYVIGPFYGYLDLNVANFILPVLFFCSIVFFPESPYYLLMKGKQTEARVVLMKYRQVNEALGKNSDLDVELLQITKQVNEDMKNKARFVDFITSSSNRRALLIVLLLAFFQRSSGVSCTIAYSTTIMPEQGGGLSRDSYMIIFSIVHVIATYSTTPLVDVVGRKPLLLISSLSTGFVTGIVSMYYYMERYTYFDVTPIKWVPYAGLVLFAVTYAIGLGFIPSTLVGELFSTNTKSYGGSVSAITFAVVSFALNRVFIAVSVQWGVHIMYWYFMLSSFACAGFVHFFVFETKGKSFSEIQNYLANLNQGDNESTAKSSV